MRHHASRNGSSSAIFAQAAATWSAMKADFDLALEAHVDAAERATRGNLLSPAGIAAGVSLAQLFAANRVSADRWASEELREFWASRPRPTLAAFEQDWFAGRGLLDAA